MCGKKWNSIAVRVQPHCNGDIHFPSAADFTLMRREYSGDQSHAGQREDTCKDGTRNHTAPDIAVLPVQVGNHTGGAAHHVAVTKGEVQSAAALVLACALYVDLGDQGGTVAVNHGATVLDEQNDEQGCSSHHCIHSNIQDHTLPCIAGAGQYPLAHVADKHGNENAQHVGNRADDTGGAELNIGRQIPDLVVNTQEGFHQPHPGSKEDDADQAHQEALAGIGPVNLRFTVSTQGISTQSLGGILLSCDDHTDDIDQCNHQQPCHNAVQVIGGGHLQESRACTGVFHSVNCSNSDLPVRRCLPDRYCRRFPAPIR